MTAYNLICFILSKNKLHKKQTKIQNVYDYCTKIITNLVKSSFKTSRHCSPGWPMKALRLISNGVLDVMDDK